MKRKVAIIIGRFQVAELHDGHKLLIETAISESDHVIVFLGSAKEYFTEKNPLPYYHRKQMIIKAYPNVQVIPLDDIPGDDRKWTLHLDVKIDELLRSNEEAILYGSRDSFIGIYENNFGNFKTKYVLSPIQEESGTAQRAAIKNVFYDSPDYRKGIIYAVLNSKK